MRPCKGRRDGGQLGEGEADEKGAARIWAAGFAVAAVVDVLAQLRRVVVEVDTIGRRRLSLSRSTWDARQRPALRLDAHSVTMA